MLPLPFLVIKGLPLRAVARWPPAPVTSLCPGNEAGHAGLHHCVELTFAVMPSRISCMAETRA